MGSTEKGGGKKSGKLPNYRDDKLMTQGFREMNLNVYDSDGWLLINKETNARAMNDPRVAPTPAPRAWGQPAMFGRPRAGEQVSWNNFHPPGAGLMYRPPNWVNYGPNGAVMGNFVGPPPLKNVVGVNGGGDYQNSSVEKRWKNHGAHTPDVVIDSSDDEEEVGDNSGSKPKYGTNSKAQTKGVNHGQGIAPNNPWGYSGAVSSQFMNGVNAPSNVLHPGFGYSGWSPAGRGVMSYQAPYPPPPPMPYPAPHFPPPPRTGQDYAKKGKSVAKVNSHEDGFTTENGEDSSDEGAESEDGVTRTNLSRQSGHPGHGHVGVDPRLGMHGNVPFQRPLQSQVRPLMGVMPPPNLNHDNRSWNDAARWNAAAGFGSSQAKAASHGGKKEVQYHPSNVDGTKSTHSHYNAKENLSKSACKQKYLQNPSAKEMIHPGGLNPISGANSCKMSAKNGGQKREFLVDTDSSDFDDEFDSEFDDNEHTEIDIRHAAESFKKTSDKSGKELEKKCYNRQTSKVEDDGKQKKQCGNGEATDVSAGKLLQKETMNVAEQSNANTSVFEDYKNRMKEVAKLFKSHITSKHEGVTCADMGKQLMKIREELLEMKKRHQEEEQELQKQYDAALKYILLKQSAGDCDSDASDEL